jgi:hypothetical protein
VLWVSCGLIGTTTVVAFRSTPTAARAGTEKSFVRKTVVHAHGRPQMPNSRASFRGEIGRSATF